jgi:hypothetical protein
VRLTVSSALKATLLNVKTLNPFITILPTHVSTVNKS